MIELLIQEQVWKLNKSFNISRGAKITADTLQVHLIKDGEKVRESVSPIPGMMKRLTQ